jgi:hypothetical protein
MVPQTRPLIEGLAERPDCRRPHGKRPPWGAILARAWSAMLCGSRSETAIAEWGRHDGAPLGPAWGLTPRSPWAAPLHTVLRRVDREAVAATRGAWAAGLCGEAPPPERGEDARAMDGQPWRGSQQQGAPGAPLRAA